MSHDFLNPDGAIAKTRQGDLPHWSQGEVMQFVTFRLGDALPKDVVAHWKAQSQAFKNTWPPPWTLATEKEYHQKFTVKLERWLDQGSGSCLFSERTNREILTEVLMHFHRERVEHQAWVIMPNHVHLLFRPIVPIATLIQAWKSVSAKRIGKGTIWQPSYRDTLIRDYGHFANAVMYIRKNPVKATLADHQFTLWLGERAQLVP